LFSKKRGRFVEITTQKINIITEWMPASTSKLRINKKGISLHKK
jgi:hypothetical protein